MRLIRKGQLGLGSYWNTALNGIKDFGSWIVEGASYDPEGSLVRSMAGQKPIAGESPVTITNKDLKKKQQFAKNNWLLGYTPFAATALPYLAPGTAGGNLIGTLAGATAGGELVNEASKAITGNTWGQNVYSTVASLTPKDWHAPQLLQQMGHTAADFTNPGYVMGGPLIKAITNIPIRFGYQNTSTSLSSGTEKLFSGVPIKETRDPFGYIPEVEKSKLTMAERLGIPKGDRGNLSRAQKEAISDLEHMFTKGYAQKPMLDADGKVKWSGKPTNTMGQEFTSQILEQYPNAKVARNGDTMWEKDGVTYVYHVSSNKISTHVNNVGKIEEFSTPMGDLSFRPGSIEQDILMTSPRTGAFDLESILEKAGINPNLYPQRIDSKDVGKFWASVEESARPGSYITGDSEIYPLGRKLMQKSLPGHRDVSQLILNSKQRPGYYQGLSADSYLAILKQAARNPERYSLRYSDVGMGQFNGQTIDNLAIANAHKQALKGEIPLQQFVDQFNAWVKPYNGMPAKIMKGEPQIIRDNSGNIIETIPGKDRLFIPHPFLLAKKKGGKINKQF